MLIRVLVRGFVDQYGSPGGCVDNYVQCSVERAVFESRRSQESSTQEGRDAAKRRLHLRPYPRQPAGEFSSLEKAKTSQRWREWYLKRV